jgi:serine/threonine-protein kinase HipA
MKYKYVCPGCFKEIQASAPAYCSACRRHLFEGKKITPTLPFSRTLLDETASVATLFFYRGSVQIQAGGDYLLRPVPTASGIRYQGDIPANRHLMMQLASQRFGIDTAASGLIYFQGGEAACISRRFDMREGEPVPYKTLRDIGDGAQESYEALARLIKRHTATPLLETERFFGQLVFNFMICNTDADASRFGLLQRPSGDFGLAPAHNLIATVLHYQADPLLPLPLFDNAPVQPLKRSDFLRFAQTVGVKEERAVRFLNRFAEAKDAVFTLAERSFLSPAAKKIFKKHYLDRLYDISDTFGRPRHL